MGEMELHTLARSAAYMHDVSAVGAAQLLLMGPAQQLLQGRFFGNHWLSLWTISNQHRFGLATRLSGEHSPETGASTGDGRGGARCARPRAGAHPEYPCALAERQWTARSPLAAPQAQAGAHPGN